MSGYNNTTYVYVESVHKKFKYDSKIVSQVD